MTIFGVWAVIVVVIVVLLVYAYVKGGYWRGR